MHTARFERRARLSVWVARSSTLLSQTISCDRQVITVGPHPPRRAFVSTKEGVNSDPMWIVGTRVDT